MSSIDRRNSSDLQLTGSPSSVSFEMPYGITTDDVYLFVTNTSNNSLEKRLMSDFSIDSQIGSFGSGNDEFILPTFLSIIEDTPTPVVEVKNSFGSIIW